MQQSDLEPDLTFEKQTTGQSDNLEREQTEAAPVNLSFGQMMASTLWAALGVQNKKNRERDFTRGKASHFIFFGIGFTCLFVLGVYALVSLVLSGSS